VCPSISTSDDGSDGVHNEAADRDVPEPGRADDEEEEGGRVSMPQ
jgi:hypothetical protein